MECQGTCPCPDCVCPAVFQPVCGTNNQTFTNSCWAGCAGVGVQCEGDCPCQECQCIEIYDPVCGENGKNAKLTLPLYSCPQGKPIPTLVKLSSAPELRSSARESVHVNIEIPFEIKLIRFGIYLNFSTYSWLDEKKLSTNGLLKDSERNSK